MEELCARFLEAWEADRIDKLVLIPMFILDFLCIHPFNDGNGRMSRLLTLLLFYKAGYIVGKYVSMEMLIEKTKETYYDPSNQTLKFAPQTIINETDQKLCSFMSESLYTRLPVSS